MALAYSYVRFSTPEQAKGDSYRRQNERYMEICKRHELSPATQYFDEGKSAFKGNKQRDLQAFLTLVKDGQVPQGSWLVVESLDRISRKGFWALAAVIQELVGSGITVCTTQPERTLSKANIDEPFAIMEILFIASRAHDESKTKSMRVRAAWSAKLANASKQIVTARGPLWLKLVNDEWQQIPERVDVIRKIFELATTHGMGHRAIAKWLNGNGIKTWGRAKAWGWAYVQQILTDRKVLGDFNTTSGTIPGYYPAIIDGKVFARANAQVKKRRRFRGNTSARVSNLFSGLAFDVTTGSSMVYVKKAADRPARWIPSAFELNNAADAAKAVSFPYDTFENEALRLLGELTIKDVGTSSATGDGSLDELEGELAAVDSQIDDLKRSITSLKMSATDGVEMLNSLARTREGLVNTIEEMKSASLVDSPQTALENSQTILDELASAKGSELVDLRLRLRQAIRGLISRIDVTLIKQGWKTTLKATIHFHSGHKRRLAMMVRRGELMLTVADTEKHKGKSAAKFAEIAPEFAHLEEIAHKAAAMAGAKVSTIKVRPA